MIDIVRVYVWLAGDDDWTDITSDLTADPLVIDYGINGSGPNDRVAKTGTFGFGLQNWAQGARPRGYYTVDGLNCRTGFREGILVKVEIDDGTNPPWVKHYGTLDAALPESGVFTGLQTVKCKAVDWMNIAATQRVTGLATQTDKRFDELLDILIASMTTPPTATDFAVGSDTYAFAFDSTADDKVSVMSELQRLASSEVSFIYVKGDGTLVAENRTTRPLTTSADTFSDTDTDGTAIVHVEPAFSRGDIYNKFQVTTHPRATDDTYSVLARLVNPVQVGGNSSYTLLFSYKDPNQEAARIGGTDMQDPVAGTDFAAYDNSDGTGTVRTTDFTVVANFTGNGVRLTITNHATSSAWLTLCQVRGKAVRDFTPVIGEREDAESIDRYGLNTGSVEMKYQSSPLVGDGAAAYLTTLYRDHQKAKSVTFFGGANQLAFLGRLMAREPGDRITLSETMTGLDEVDFCIQAVKIEFDALWNYTVTFGLAPIDNRPVFLVEVPGHAEIGTTTIVGF